MMLMETKQAIQCKDSLEITTITMMTKKTITKPAKKMPAFFCGKNDTFYFFRHIVYEKNIKKER